MRIPASRLSTRKLLAAATRATDDLFNAREDPRMDHLLGEYCLILQALDRCWKLATTIEKMKRATP